MTGQQRIMTVHLTAGTPTTGLWCDTCLLPSRYQIPFYVLGDDGPCRVAVMDRCERHQA